MADAHRTKDQKLAQRYERAIRWALGELGDFDFDRTLGAFAWRTELQRRAGLRWSAKKQKFVPKEIFRG